jgi:hypothetical protein
MSGSKSAVLVVGAGDASTARVATVIVPASKSATRSCCFPSAEVGHSGDLS